MSTPARRRRSFTLVELIVVIAVLLLLMAIALPSFLGTRDAAQDAAVKSAITVSYHDAKAIWAVNAAYPATLPLIGELGSAEPGYEFVAGTPTVPATQLKVEVDGDDTVTICGLSASGTYFCLRADEQGALMSAAADESESSLQMAAAESVVARSRATSLALAECLLPTEDDLTTCTGSEPGEGARGWSSALANAPSSESPLMVAFTAPPTDTDTSPSFAFEVENGYAAECALDEGPYEACTSPFAPSVDVGEHTVSVRIGGEGGSGDSHSFMAWGPPSIFPGSQTAMGRTLKTSQSVSYSSSNATSVACFLDEAASPCSPSTFTASDLAEGTHTARIVVSNPAGMSAVHHLEDWQVVQYPSLVADALPWAYFRMNEAGTAANDYAGSASLAWTGGTSRVAAPAAPGAEFARTLDGSGVGTATGMPLLTGDWTIEAWIKPGGTTGFQPVVALSGNTFVGVTHAGGDNWLVYVGLPDGHSFYSTATVPTGGWSHLAVTYGGGTARIYLNGVQRGSESGVPPLTTPPTTWTVGAMSGANSFIGALDELAVYKTALPAGVIASRVAY